MNSELNVSDGVRAAATALANLANLEQELLEQHKAVLDTARDILEQLLLDTTADELLELNLKMPTLTQRALEQCAKHQLCPVDTHCVLNGPKPAAD